MVRKIYDIYMIIECKQHALECPKLHKQMEHTVWNLL